MHYLDMKARAAMMALFMKMKSVRWIGWGDVLHIVAITIFILYAIPLLNAWLLLQGTSLSYFVIVITLFVVMYVLDRYASIKRIMKGDTKARDYLIKTNNGIKNEEGYVSRHTLTSPIILVVLKVVNIYQGNPAVIPAVMWWPGFDLLWLVIVGRTLSYLFNIAIVTYAMQLPAPEGLVAGSSPVNESNPDEVAKKE